MESIESIEERFWSRINKKGPVVRPELGPCWVWTGYCSKKNGYGYLTARKISKAPMTAHTVAWRLGRGPIPKGKGVCHKCDYPPCCNYETHLFLGTQKENNKDRSHKGRTAQGDKNGARTRPERNPFVRDRGSGLHGESHPMAVLSQKQINAIREGYTGKYGDKARLAREYHLSQTHIGRILQRRSWSAHAKDTLQGS